MRIIDAHCHFHAYSKEAYKKYEKITIIAVSDDYDSSIKTCMLSKSLSNIVPFVGIHPWNIDNLTSKELDQIRHLIENEKALGIGEVGLDFRFSKASKDLQVKIFDEFCRIAAEKKMPLNIHSYSAWKEALTLVAKHDVKSVLFHWYTGPEELLREINNYGYFISVNPTVTIQPKQRKIIEKASVESILTESDGPYVYRTVQLDSSMIHYTLEIISEIKKISIDELSQIISSNYERYISS
ncbi:MAG: TatD family hydrolase [Nitrososphaerota archaeon]